MSKYVSPNGDDIVGAFETTPCTAGISGINNNGTPEYDGTGSVMHWDDQKPILRDGKRLFVCEGGGHWTFDQLKKKEEGADSYDLDLDEFSLVTSRIIGAPELKLSARFQRFCVDHHGSYTPAEAAASWEDEQE